MTPKGFAVARKSLQASSREADAGARASNAGQRDLQTILIEERDGAVYFARIPDLARFMANHDLHVHEDVLETLADLVLTLVGEEGNDGSGSRG